MKEHISHKLERKNSDKTLKVDYNKCLRDSLWKLDIQAEKKKKKELEVEPYTKAN